MRLRTACEKAKCHLSSYTTARIEIDSLIDDVDFYTSIKRDKFEELNADLFRDALDLVEKALRDAKFDKIQIDEVFLAGGSSRIPKVQQLLREFFNGKTLNKSVNPDEAVAFGTAFRAAILSGVRHASVDATLTLDVYPNSLGVEVAGGVMLLVIKRNSTIPTKLTQILTTYSDNQTKIILRIFEGERAMVKDNIYINEIEIEDITPAPKGEAEIEVTFDIDASFELKVTIEDKTNKTKFSKVIKPQDRPKTEIPNDKIAAIKKF